MTWQCTWYNHCYPDYFLFTFTKILLKMTMTWQFLGQHTGHHSNGLPCLSQVYLGQIYIWAKLYLYISGFNDCRKGEGEIGYHRFWLNSNFFHWLQCPSCTSFDRAHYKTASTNLGKINFYKFLIILGRSVPPPYQEGDWQSLFYDNV